MQRCSVKKKLIDKKLKYILGQMLIDIVSNEGALEELKWYFCKRGNRITRDSFFRNYVWAVWVAGKSYKSAKTFLEKAQEFGFSWDYKEFGSLTRREFESFVRKLHKNKPRAFKMWESIYKLAKKLKTYKTEKEFRDEFFSGKTDPSTFSDKDVRRLLDMNLGFIGEASARFILRNMGGEFIKDDVWIKTFCNFIGIDDLETLKRILNNLGIRYGLFDVIVWTYGSFLVGRKDNFAKKLKLLESSK